jgi:hypothetical protein
MDFPMAVQLSLAQFASKILGRGRPGAFGMGFAEAIGAGVQSSPVEAVQHE